MGQRRVTIPHGSRLEIPRETAQAEAVLSAYAQGQADMADALLEARLRHPARPGGITPMFHVERAAWVALCVALAAAHVLR